MDMKLRKKLTETVRIREYRATKLKDKCLEITIKSGIQVQESDPMNFLIDEGLEKIAIKDNSLELKL